MPADLSDRDIRNLNAIISGHDGDMVRSDRGDFSRYDGINPVVAQGLLQSLSAPQAPPAAPQRMRPQSPYGMLTGGDQNQQLMNMLAMFNPMTAPRGMYGMQGYQPMQWGMQGSQQPWGGQQPRQAVATGAYGQPLTTQQRSPVPGFTGRYG